MKSFKQFLTENISLEYHDELNQKLFDGDKLKSDVRLKLLHFAAAWVEFANQDHVAIKPDMIKDVYMTGGNVNFNYTPQSDIDVHVIVDKSKVEDVEVFDKLMDNAKQLWTAKHKDVKVKGYPLEPYAQDINIKLPDGQGAYSLMHDKWVMHPENKHLDFQHDKKLEAAVDDWEKRIDDLIAKNASPTEFDKLGAELRTLRGDSIKRDGEFAFGNLVFKELRNRGILDKMNDFKRDEFEHDLTLESKNENI